jgi:hypothetical protein
MRHGFTLGVIGMGLQEEHLAALLQELGLTAHDPRADRAEILHFHFQGRASAEMVLEQMSH